MQTQCGFQGYSGRGSRGGYAGPRGSEVADIWEVVSELATALQDARNQLVNLMHGACKDDQMRLAGGRSERSVSPSRDYSPRACCVWIELGVPRAFGSNSDAGASQASGGLRADERTTTLHSPAARSRRRDEAPHPSARAAKVAVGASQGLQQAASRRRSHEPQRHEGGCEFHLRELLPRSKAAASLPGHAVRLSLGARSASAARASLGRGGSRGQKAILVPLLRQFP
jgi:hypothetical protein